MELTTSQAARSYEAHPNVLHRMILMGRLKARKDANGHWLISKDSLDRWNNSRAHRARKRDRSTLPVGEETQA
jgi:hypothetical protein